MCVAVAWQVKRPAFAKKLLETRTNGVHPSKIALVFGDAWQAPGPGYVLRVAPAEYQVGVFDFCAVAGLPVDVWDMEAEPARTASGAPAIFHAAAEVAFWSPDVRYCRKEWGRNGVDIAHLATIHARASRDERNRIIRGWPEWWSDDLESRYVDNQRRHTEYKKEIIREAIEDGGDPAARHRLSEGD